jgi:short-subunit dehydrogenase
MADKIAVVVGVGEGIGLAVARRFARAGFRLALVARRMEALQEYVDDLTQNGAEANAFAADAGDTPGLIEAFKAIKASVGAPEVLIYNAAAVVSGVPSALDVQQLEANFRVNVGGALVASQQVIPEMVARKSGTILFTGGGLALNPNPNYAALAIGKAGLRSLAYSLGAELEPQGVHVATVTVAGFVQPGTHFDPDKIAEKYWELHTQPAGSWEREIVYR